MRHGNPESVMDFRFTGVHLRFYVGAWRVEPLLNRIVGDRETVQVEPKVMQVLVCLAERAPEVVSKDALIETVWAGTVVTTDVLARAVSELRRVFRDDPRNPGVIETIRGTGYRLIVPVALDGPGEGGLPAPPPSQAPRERPGRVAAYARRGFLALALLIGVLGWFWVGRATAPAPPAWQKSPLTSYPGPEAQPALSPDGRQLAFVWAGPEGKNVDVYVKLIGTETPLRLTDDPAPEQNPVWSPGGARVAFIRIGEAETSIYIASALGQDERRLIALEGVGGFDWSPDGAWFAVSGRSSSEEAYRIFLHSATTLERRRLHPPGKEHEFEPRFSPDGSTLAFKSVTSEGVALYTVPVAGGASTRLGLDSQHIAGHTWTADGKSLVFSSIRGGYYSLWRVPAEGGKPIPLNLDDDEDLHPAIARRSARLVYTKRTQDRNIWRVRLDRASGGSSQPARLIASTRLDAHPQRSPDGRRIAFVSNRSGPFELWLSDSTGAQQTRLTTLGSAFIGMPRWSPDGRRIAFDARLDDQADLYVIDVDAALPRRLTSDPSDERAASWSRDGRWIYFDANRGGRWEVWKIPAVGGEAVPVTQEGGSNPMESPDGTFLYVARAPGLWRLSVQGGAAEQVLGRLPDRSNWAVVADGIYLLQRDPSVAFSFYRFDTGETTEVFVPPGAVPEAGAAFSVSADGRWLLYEQVDRSEQDIMLADPF